MNKIDAYTLLFFIGGCTLVLRLKDKPKSLQLIQFATLIIPPNDLEPQKDRFGLFNNEAYNIIADESLALQELERFRRRVKHLNDCSND